MLTSPEHEHVNAWAGKGGFKNIFLISSQFNIVLCIRSLFICQSSSFFAVYWFIEEQKTSTKIHDFSVNISNIFIRFVVFSIYF